MLLRVTGWKNKNQNFDFEVARNCFSEVTLYNSELFEKNVAMLDFVILDIDLALNRYFYNHEITQHMYCVMLLRFLKKVFVISLLCC